MSLEELLKELKEDAQPKAEPQPEQKPKLEPVKAEIVVDEEVAEVEASAEALMQLSERDAELNQHKEVCTILISNYAKNQREIQKVIDRYMDAALAPEGEFPRAAIDVVTKMLEIKTHSGDIVVRALDSRSKLLSALKAPAQNNTQNNFSVNAVESDRIKNLLAKPMQADENI